MANIQTIPNKSHVDLIIYKPSYSTICSVGKAPFNGTIEIRYIPGELLLEFESFEVYLTSLSLKEFTIESLTRTIFDELVRALGDIPLHVQVYARTTVHAPASAILSRKWRQEYE